MDRSELKLLQALEDWRAVLDLPAGRRVLAGMLECSNLLGASYAPGDALATAHNEGLRRMGRFIADNVLRARPALLAEMLATQGDNDGSGE